MKAASASIKSAGMDVQLRKSRIGSLVDRRILVRVLLVSAGCYFGSQLGTWLRFPGPGAAIVFPPYAVLTVALLLSRPWHWWAYLVASFVGHSLANLPNWPTGVVLVSEAANITKALLAAIAIQHLNNGPRLNSFRRMATFLIFGVFVAPAAAAFIGAAMTTYYNSSSSYWLAWRTWFLSNAITGATLLPVLLISITDFPRWLRAVSVPRLMEIGLFTLSLFTVSYFVLVWPGHSFSTLPPRTYWLFPILLWAAVRLGPGGTSAAILAVSAMAIGGAMQANQTLVSTEDLLALQLFVIIISVPLLFLAALIDERDEVSETLRESEERVTLAAEAAHLGVWGLNTTTNKLWMSDKARELFQFKLDQAISYSEFLARAHPKDRMMRDAALARAIETKACYEIEYRALLPDGTVRWMSSRARCVNDDKGQPTQLLGVSVDVTERKLAEEQARKSREEFNRLSRISLLGEMTASLAHDLTQPLSAIISNANAAKRFIERGNEDPEILRNILADVAADGHRAHDIIQDVRNTIKKGAAIRHRINLNELVTNVAHVVRPDAVACSCEVETSLAKDLPLIEGDPIQIQQVLVNLVSNAFDAMRETPPSQRKVEISTAGSGNGEVRLSVRDHGTGIRADVHDRLFDQFFTTKEQGLGMGLAIVRSIVEAHGGQIDAENVPDGGARFYFTLPAADKT